MKRIFLSLPLPYSFNNSDQKVSDILSHIDGLHLDIMDGIFVDAQQGSVIEIDHIRRTTDLPLWIHLMTAEPLHVILQLSLNPGDIVSVHYEHQRHYPPTTLSSIAEKIIAKGGLPSCAVSPSTPLTVITDILPSFNHILLMTVNPGKSGQVMLPDSAPRYNELREIIAAYNPQTTIGLDGGISPETLLQFSFAPSDKVDIAAYSSILESTDPLQNLARLRQELERS